MLIASQIVGLCAVGLYLLSYQLKKRTHIVWVTCVSNALYVTQYLMLGAFSGAVMDFMSTVSSFFAGKKNSPRLKPFAKQIATVNILMIIAVGLAIACIRRNPLELLPIAGAVFQTVGLWCEDEQKIRRFGLLCSPFWFVYNFMSRAYGASLGSVLAIVSALTALLRYRRGKKEHKTTE